jgi:hypothetical protein
MEFHVLQSYLIRIQIPNDKGLHTGTESLFFLGIGYWNSMFFNRRGTEKKSREIILCDSLRLCGSMILTAEAQRTHRAKKRYQGIHN